MQHMGYFERVTAQTPTRLWINNVTPEEGALAIAAGAVGCTQNPTYPYKMLTHPVHGNHAQALLDEIIIKSADDNAAQAALQIALIQEVAEVFLPLHSRTHDREGYVTIQANPFRHDVASICEAARLHCAHAPNIMAKIPAIPAGFEAMEILLREGLPLLATEVMSVSQAICCAEIYRRACAEMKNPPVMYFAHIPGIFDEYLAKLAAREGIDVPQDYLYQAGVLVAKKIAAILREKDYAIGFCSGGARGLHHFTEMVGARCCVTINWGSCAETLVRQNPPVVDRFAAPMPEMVVDTLCERIPDFRKAFAANGLNPEEYEDFGPVQLFNDNFTEAWAKALHIIQERRKALGA